MAKSTPGPTNVMKSTNRISRKHIVTTVCNQPITVHVLLLKNFPIPYSKFSNCRVKTEWFCNKQQLNKTPQNFHLFNFFITQKSQQISQADPLPFFFSRHVTHAKIFSFTCAYFNSVYITKHSFSCHFYFCREEQGTLLCRSNT